MISRALHLDVFDQPENNYFFNNLIKVQLFFHRSAIIGIYQ